MEDGERGRERWENVQELRSTAQEFQYADPGEKLTEFLQGVALVSDVDTLKEATDSITLITLHQAKGLEFPVVFIVGLEEGLLPHIRSFDDPNQMEEERRLFYVGMTRAKNKRGGYAVRESELRSELENSLTARATLAREHQLLQEDLAERVRRLEAACPDTSISPRSSH